MEHDGASCSLRLLVDKNDYYHSFSLDHLGDFDYIVIFCVREIFPFFNFIRAENFYAFLVIMQMFSNGTFLPLKQILAPRSGFPPCVILIAELDF